MIKNFKIIIEYDGSAYHGWQRQKNCRSIQGEIEKALSTITRESITVTGSGRTDAGVHAFGQTANFHSYTHLSPEVLQKGITSLVSSKDIVIKKCEQIDANFHAQYGAKSKTYRYVILNNATPDAIYRQYSWFVRKKLDIDAMCNSLCHIIGTHDFKAFEGAGSPKTHTIRNIINADIIRQNLNYIVLNIEGNGFLRFMVRNIVGTLVDVGLRKITADNFKKILLSKDRGLAGTTAPAHGLFLMNVKY